MKHHPGHNLEKDGCHWSSNHGARRPVASSLVVLTLALPGCGAVAPLQTAEREQGRLELRKRFAVSTYPGKSHIEVLDAVMEVLQDLDRNGEFSVEAGANVLLASRDWAWFGGPIGSAFCSGHGRNISPSCRT
jgi:hypothetical protein